MKKLTLKEEITSKGMTIRFLEREAELPRNTLYNLVNGAQTLPVKHLPSVKKVLKKYKINLVM